MLFCVGTGLIGSYKVKSLGFTVSSLSKSLLSFKGRTSILSLLVDKQPTFETVE